MKLYFSELKPNERILKILEDFLNPFLEKHNFKFSKSQKQFKRKNGFFENHISFYSNRHNDGISIVEFQIYITIHSPEYYKWEKKYYNLSEKSPENVICGNLFFGFDNWTLNFADEIWYNLAEFDNEKLVNEILYNIENSSFPYFEKYNSLSNGIIELTKDVNEGNFNKIFDFLLIEDENKKAVEFFEEHNYMFEKELCKNESDSYFSLNYKDKYLLRKTEYEKIKNHI